MNSLNFLYTIYFLSIIIISIGVFISIFYIVPLFYRLSKVKNGLAKLRKLMLMQALLNVLIGISALFTLTLRFIIDGEVAKYSITLFILAFAVSFLLFVVTWVIMFKEQFTKKQIRIHAKAAKMEEKENKENKGV